MAAGKKEGVKETEVSNVPSLIRLRPRSNLHYISHNRMVFAMNRDGFVDGLPEEGLYYKDTRLLSHYKYFVNGELPTAVALSSIDPHSWLGYYIVLAPGYENEPVDDGSGMIPKASEQTLEMRILRTIELSLSEEIEFTNHTQTVFDFTFEIELKSDFADLSETRKRRTQTGRITRKFGKGKNFFYELKYRASHKRRILHRGVCIRGTFPTDAVFLKQKIRTGISLQPHESWRGSLKWIPQIEKSDEQSLDNKQIQRRSRLFFNRATEFRSPESETLTPVVLGALNQAKSDLDALRLFDLDTNATEWTLSAGLPIYIALFGRDVLTASWQASLLNPDLMRGSLKQLSLWQGKKTDDWRDEQPGKMLHEAHDGPLEMLDYNPRRRYYGSITTSGFYPFVLSELWHWTGDRSVVKGLLNSALRSLQWLDEYSDFDRDGFFEYQTRSSQGVQNQAWKDSGDAIVYEDGSKVEAPIATCEEQAFVYAAKLHLSEVLWWLNEKDQAKKIYHQAEELKKRFNEIFWMPKEDYIAMGLDPKKRQIQSISSNPGHCIASGIVDQSLIRKCSERLMQPDLFSGWGIRTLSNQHPAYNPFSYHRGSVWPVEQASFVMGLMRYGMHDSMEALCLAQFRAAALFDYFRLPELFSGHPRDREHPFPAFYPDANSPQAWSASAIFLLIQAMLGLYPYAPLNLLLVDPHLPKWLPEITLTNLHVGRAVVAIRFFRKKNGASGFKVLDVRGKLHVIGQPSPWSLTATFGERLKDALHSYV